LAVKGNQEHLLEDIQTTSPKHWTANLPSTRSATITTTEEAHGRKETRTYRTITNLDDISGPQTLGWPHHRVPVLARMHHQRRNDREVRYFIASGRTGARKLAKATRDHWGIEINKHWQLDVSFGEDASKIQERNRARNFATIAPLGPRRFEAKSRQKEHPRQTQAGRPGSRVSHGNPHRSAKTEKILMRIAVISVEGKSNEIKAIPELLKLLDLNGALVTIDAIGCQKVIASRSSTRAATTSWPSKATKSICWRTFKRRSPKPLDGQLAKHQVATITTTEEAHGRKETRTYRTITNLDDIRDRNSGLASPPCACVGANAPSTAQRPRKSATSSPVGARELASLPKRRATTGD